MQSEALTEPHSSSELRCVLLEKPLHLIPVQVDQHVRHGIFFCVIEEGERFENVHPVITRLGILTGETSEEMIQAELLARDVEIDEVSFGAAASYRGDFHGCDVA